MNENGQSPVTKDDLDSALESLLQRVGELVDGRFGQFEGRLQHLDGRFGQFEGRLQHLDGRFGDFEGRLQHLDGRFGEFERRLQQLSDHFDERIYDTETKLLRAFREFQNAQDVRLRKLEANLGNLDTAASLRLAQLEATVNDLQARLIQLEDRPQ